MLRHRVFFIFALLFFFVSAARAETNLWLQALDYLQSEKDSAGIQVLTDRIRQERPYDQVLIRRLLEIEVAKNNRSSLRSFVMSLYQANSCTFTHTKVCKDLVDLWEKNLKSLMFFETTAPRLENVRRLRLAGDCASALPVLKEIASQEGDFSKLLDSYREVYACLKDESALEDIDRREQNLRLF